MPDFAPTPADREDMEDWRRWKDDRRRIRQTCRDTRTEIAQGMRSAIATLRTARAIVGTEDPYIKGQIDGLEHALALATRGEKT